MNLDHLWLRRKSRRKHRNAQQDDTPEAEFDIDTLNPSVANVTSTKANGTYGDGEVIDVTVTF